MTTTTSPAARRRSLQRAEEVRLRRASERQAIRTLPTDQARARLAELIIEAPDWLETVYIETLLCWLPYVGEVAALKVFQQADVHSWLTLGVTTMRQRTALAEALVT